MNNETKWTSHIFAMTIFYFQGDILVSLLFAVLTKLANNYLLIYENINNIQNNKILFRNNFKF